MISVAVDVMGGDGGPPVCMAGVETALESILDLSVIAVGRHSEIANLVEAMPTHLANRVRVVDAPDVLAPDVTSLAAVRGGQHSSMAIAIGEHRLHKAQAVVSAGSSTGLMTLSRHLLGMAPGVERPALMTRLPTQKGFVWVLDLGANVGVDAQRLHEFATLGHASMAHRGQQPPAIGLLNIGTEKNKGPDVLREAARLLSADESLHYVGFIEADQVFQGDVDLVVCDGFAGNIMLKSAQGGVRLVLSSFEHQLETDWIGRAVGWFVRSRWEKVCETLNPANHNGARLMGIEGLVIKSHGSADASGFAKAIFLAHGEATMAGQSTVQGTTDQWMEHEQ